MINPGNKKISSVAIYILLVVFLLPVGLFSFKHPAYNWDMLGYMAIVIKMDGTKEIQKVHAITYQTAKANLPQRVYQQLLDSNGPRARFATDPNFFEKVLPIYVVKPLYNWLSFVFYKSGVALPIATLLPSLIAFFLIALLVFHWLKKFLSTVVAFVSVLLIMTFSFVVASSTLSTPDNLSAFFLLSAFYFILQRPAVGPMFLFLLLSILTRADNIIIASLIISFLALSNKWNLKIKMSQYFIMLFIFCIAYLVIILPIKQYGWTLLYYSEYVKHMNFSRDFNAVFTWSDYFSYMYTKAIAGLVSSHFTLFMFFATLIITQPFPMKLRLLSFEQLFTLLLVSIILFRFLLLPDISDRFYVSFYLVIMILLVRRHTIVVKRVEA